MKTLALALLALSAGCYSVSAKKALGEQTDHITDAAFKSRIQGMEQDAASKHGKPVRYHVQSNGREVVLLAVPLG